MFEQMEKEKDFKNRERKNEEVKKSTAAFQWAGLNVLQGQQWCLLAGLREGCLGCIVSEWCRDMDVLISEIECVWPASGEAAIDGNDGDQTRGDGEPQECL